MPGLESWEKSDGTDEKAMLLSWSSMRALDEGVVVAGAITFWSGLVLAGIGMTLSDLYPEWLGWVFIVLRYPEEISHLYDPESATSEEIAFAKRLVDRRQSQQGVDLEIEDGEWPDIVRLLKRQNLGEPPPRPRGTWGEFGSARGNSESIEAV